MKKISSGTTRFYKWILPVFWFGFLALFVTVPFREAPAELPLFFLVVPCLMAAFGFYFMKNLIWNLLDEVQDGGDYLLVRKGSDEERIPLSNVMNVNASTYLNPPRITLRLVKPGRFGGEISFLPVTGLRINRFARNPVAEDLMVRAYQARTLRS
jgi:hypothetical protein